MGEFELDTRLEQTAAGYRAVISDDWRLIGPAGGYVSALAMRAAVAESSFDRPVSYLCHYLNPAVEGTAELAVTKLRSSSRAESLRIQVTQSERPVLEALVWTAAMTDGVDHDTSEMPAAGAPLDHPPMEDLFPGWPPFRFWSNFDYRPVALPGQEPWVPGRAALRAWVRFKPAATWPEPGVAAMRLAVLADVFVYPAAQMAHAPPSPYWGASLDLAVAIHDPGIESEWLLVDAETPVSRGGLLAGHVRIWSQRGRLLADSVQQMIQLRRQAQATT